MESFSPGSIQIGVPSINNDTNMMMVRLNVKRIQGDFVLKTTGKTEFDWYGVKVMATKKVIPSTNENEYVELNENGNYFAFI